MHETFQYLGWEDRWTVKAYSTGYHGASGYGKAQRISNSPSGYTYSKTLWMHAYGNGQWWGGSYYGGCGTVTVENITPELIEYLSFVVYQAGGSIIFLDENGSTLGSFSTGIIGLYEFFMAGNSMYAVVNGEEKGIVFTSANKPYYIRFNVGACNSQANLTIDDLTTEKNTIAIGIEPELHTITGYDNDEIDVSWHVTTIPWADFEDSEYRINVTNLGSGELIDSRIIKEIPVGYEVDPPYGVERYSRDTLFGNAYAPYLFELTKNDEVLVSYYLIYRETPAPETCTQSILVTNTEDAPIPDAKIELRDYITNELISVGSTDSSGMWDIELNTDMLFSISATKGDVYAYATFVPCIVSSITLILAIPETDNALFKCLFPRIFTGDFTPRISTKDFVPRITCLQKLYI